MSISTSYSTTNRLLSTLKFFHSINEECVSTGETVVPFHKDNVEYYRIQMNNLDCPIEDIEDFCSWLETIDPQPEV